MNRRPDGDTPLLRVGMTTTVPVEVILAAGCVPVDLNNVLINSSSPLGHIEQAEIDGYPASVCAWVKGIHGVVMYGQAADLVIAVTQGDCSSTQGLMETLEDRGVRVIPFAFPYDADRDLLRRQIEKLADELGTSIDAAETVRHGLDGLRDKLRLLDTATWRTMTVTGRENLEWLVSSSDFNGDPSRFEQKLDTFIDEVRARPPANRDGPRLGYLGVPPIFSDLHDVIESRGAPIVYNEIPRQFSMPNRCRDLVDQYAQYTYPYGVFRRIADIRAAIDERRIDAVIHYAQSFCFRQIEDPILRRNLAVPLLTIEGDRPGPVDARTTTRIEAFLESFS